MPSLSAVSDTLYIPLLGRAYATAHHPYLLYDETAIALCDRLDQSIRNMRGQTEYSSLASAVRSRNIDQCVQAFLQGHTQPVIINVGCGLETLYQRNDNGKALWYELDMPEVLALRSRYLPETERDRFLAYSMFDYRWMDIVRQAEPQSVLIIASGLFLYFTQDQVVDFIRHLMELPNATLVFDTLSPAGLKIARRMIGKMGKREASVHFAVASASLFAAGISPVIKVLEEKRFYRIVHDRSEMAIDTRLRMAFSDLFNMVKLISLTLHVSNPA